MANLIRPDPVPLPPAMSTTAPVVTTIGGMPLETLPPPPVTTTPASLATTTITAVVNTAITPVTTTTAAMAMTAAITPVTPAAPVGVTPQGGAVSSAQQLTVPIGETAEAITTVAVSEVPAAPHVSGSVAFTVVPSIPGTFPSESQSQPVVGTFTTPSGVARPMSQPIIIQPPDQRPPSRIITGFEGLTLPSDPTVMVIITMARLVNPLGPSTSLQGLASHQAVSATPQVGVSATPNVIGTIHGPGTPSLIAAVEGSIESVVSASTSHEGEHNIVMIVGDDEDDIVEVGTVQGFSKIMEPKEEKMDLPPASRG